MSIVPQKVAQHKSSIYRLSELRETLGHSDVAQAEAYLRYVAQRAYPDTASLL